MQRIALFSLSSLGSINHPFQNFAGSKRVASQLKNQLHTYPPGASETGCAYPYCPDPMANNIVLDDLNAVIAQTNLSNEIQQLLAVGLPAQSALAPEYYHIVCDQEYVDPTQLSGIVADFCLCYEDPELAASQHIDCELLSDVYWYHPDYVGSNELITDITGEPYQYFFYTPFGETILQEDAFNASYDNPWRFNGKELDAESGNYYYGARYYNPKWSVWLSVDPMSERDPDYTPYHFVRNNPINLVDPNGLTWTDPDGNEMTCEQLQQVKVFIFYDEKDFSSQAMEQYEYFIEKYGEGSVALSTGGGSNEGFLQDWNDMSGSDIEEVWINFHGDSQWLGTDGVNLSSVGDLTAERRNSAVDLNNLPLPSGNVSGANLRLNSCHSDGWTPGSEQNVISALRNNFHKTNQGFHTIMGASASVSFFFGGAHPWGYGSFKSYYRPTISNFINREHGGSAAQFLFRSGMDPR